MNFKINAVGDIALIDQELRALAAAADDAVIAEALEAGSEIMLSSIRAEVSAKAKDSTGKLASGLKFRLDKSYLTGRAYKAVFGWDRTPVRRSKAGKMTVVSDYGPVLEFSDNRKLRHLETGFEAAQADAEAAMKTVITRAQERGG